MLSTEGSPGAGAGAGAAGPSASGRWLTADLPGIGGRLKEREEDFLVEEQPLYQPAGEGEHIYLFVEKRGLSTTDVVSVLARHFRVQRRAIGFAGMKDKRAITRQVFSIHTPGRSFEDFPMLRHERVGVLWADMHLNKLRLGHLRGNRFSVKVRGVRMTDVLAAQRIMQRLERTGVPNFAGEQRFGSRQNNHVLGRHLLMDDHAALVDELLGPDGRHPLLNTEARRLYAEGRYAEAHDAFPPGCRHERNALQLLAKGAGPRRAIEAVDVAQRRFWVTAFQSAVFNRVLEERLEGRPAALDALMPGDLAWKHDNGAVFAVDEATARDEATLSRLGAFEISPSGPVWGAEMTQAGGEIGALERRLLDETGVDLDRLALFARRSGRFMGGARRAMRVPVRFPEIEGGIDEHGPFVRCAFELPPGAFATVVMREVMKSEPAPGAGEGADDPHDPEEADG